MKVRKYEVWYVAASKLTLFVQKYEWDPFDLSVHYGPSFHQRVLKALKYWYTIFRKKSSKNGGYDVSLHFIKAEKRVLDSVIFPAFDLLVNPGKIAAVHSSVNIREQLIELLLGRTVLSNGEILIGGSSFSEKKLTIGFLFLQSGLYERLTVEEMLRFTQRLYHSDTSVDGTIRTIQLEAKRKVKIKQLSFSERKRVQFGCVLLQDPDIFLLEEPDQNIDLESKRIFLSILQSLKKRGKTIFILTMNLESAITSADEVYRLDENGLHNVSIENPKEDIEETIAEPILIQPVRLEKIPTKVNDKIVLFDPLEIDYIESSDGQSFLHIKGESFPSVFTLNDLEERLSPFGFFRCHRSYIVNLQKVREIITWTRNSYSLILDDAPKSNVPLSKTKMATLRDRLGL